MRKLWADVKHQPLLLVAIAGFICGAVLYEAFNLI